MQLSLRKTSYLCATYFLLQTSLNLVLKNTRRSSFLKQIPAGLQAFFIIFLDIPLCYNLEMGSNSKLFQTEVCHSVLKYSALKSRSITKNDIHKSGATKQAEEDA